MTGALIASVVTTVLSNVVVEASRLDASPNEIAGAVRVFDRAEIAASAASDVVALLERRAPQLSVRRTGAGNPALAEFSMRGYGELGHGRTLVLVDGERLNSPDMNMPNLARVALGSVDRIEVLGGPQSVLLGDGASAGAVNIVTEPGDYGRHSYGEIRGGSWNTLGVSAGTRGGLEEEGVRYWADGSWDHSDGCRENSGYDHWNLTGGVRKDWEGGSYLRVSSFWNDSDSECPGYLSRTAWHDDPESSLTPDDWYRRRTYGLNTTFRAQLDAENALKVTGTVSRREMETFSDGRRLYGFDYTSRNDYDTYSYRLLTEWINTADVFGLENEFIAGSQCVYDRLHGWMRSDGLLGGTATKCVYDRQTMDWFAHDTLHLTDVFSLQAGGRWSRAWAGNTQCSPSSRTDDMTAFDVAALANPTDASKLYLKWSRFYRAPFLDEIPYDPQTFLPAGLLRPESGWSAEFGGEWSVTDEFSFGGDAYWMTTEDEIFYDAIGRNNVNSEDETDRSGVDVHLDWEREKTAGVTLAASWVDARFDGGAYDGKTVPLVPETTVALDGRLWLWDEFRLVGGYRYQSYEVSASDFRNAFDTIPAFGVFRLGAVYEPAWGGLEGLRLSFAIDNLFDREVCDYATYGANYWPGAGRSVTFTVRYEF